MQKVKYINSNNESINFNITPPLVLQKIEGTGNVNTNIQSQKSPFQDGRTFIQSNLETREIFVQVAILTSDSREVFRIRQEIQKIFNPKLGEGVLFYNTPNGIKKINAIVDGTPIFSDYNGDNVTCQITFLCHDPFWYELDESVYEFNAPYIPMFEFPFFSTEDSLLEFGLERDNITIENVGTAYTPLVIEFYGGVKDATLTNETTGEFIKINKELLDNETLIIDTSFGKRKVRLSKSDGDSENGFKYISLDSKFLQLQEGENLIKYEAEANKNVKVTLKWTPRYLGL